MQTEMLDSALSNHPDYKQVFFIEPSERPKRVQVRHRLWSPHSETVQMRSMAAICCQCARVASTDARLWVRLVGQRHDLQMWQPDSRGLDTLQCKRNLRSLRASEEWAATLVQYVQRT